MSRIEIEVIDVFRISWEWETRVVAPTTEDVQLILDRVLLSASTWMTEFPVPAPERDDPVRVTSLASAMFAAAANYPLKTQTRAYLTHAAHLLQAGAWTIDKALTYVDPLWPDGFTWSGRD
jgi:hypothetical protein